MSTENDGNPEVQSSNGPDSPAEIEATVTPTRQRSRRRVAITTLTVGVLIAGTIIGIQQLSGTRDDSPNLAVPPTPAPEVSSSTNASTIPGTNGVVAPTAPPMAIQPTDDDDPALSALRSSADTAQLVPANITWSVVPDDSPEALAYRFDSTQRYAFQPRSGAPNQFDVYEQVNGNWDQIEFESRAGLTPAVSGDTIYGFGTEPATAGGPEGSFGTFDVASGTWRLHELPKQALPYESEKVSAYLSFDAIPVDDGLIVAISSTNDLRSETDRQPIGDSQLPPIVTRDSISLFNDCDFNAWDSAQSDSSAQLSSEKNLELARKFCTDETTVGASDLGLSQADLDALQKSWQGDAATSVWKVTADSIVPFELPGGANVYSLLSPRMLLVAPAGQASPSTLYVVAHDGSLTEVFGDLPPELLGQVQPPRDVTGPDVTTVIGGLSSLLLTQQLSGPTQVTDVLGAVATSEMVNPYMNLMPSGTSGSLSATNAELCYDPPGTLSEPTTVSDSGYTMDLRPGIWPQFIDDRTGRFVDFNYMLSTEAGNVQLLRYPDRSTVTANPVASGPTTTTVVDNTDEDPVPIATFDVDWTTVPGLNSKCQFLLLTSTDGVHISPTDLESIVRQKIPVSETETLLVFPGQARLQNGRIVVSAWVMSNQEVDGPSSDGGVRSFVVVGTPN